MCRIMGLYASRESYRYVRSLLSHFYNASINDYLNRELGGDGRHCHGFGYVIIGYEAGGLDIVYHRHDAADVYGRGEESCRLNIGHMDNELENLASRLDKYEWLFLVLHSRRTTRYQPRGAMHTHPYHVTYIGSDGVYEYYVAHNGGLHKDVMGAEIDVPYTYISDSNVLAHYVARLASRGTSIASAISSASKYTREHSALVAVVLRLGYRGDGVSVELYASGYNPHGLTGLYERYYRPIVFEARGLAGFASSTIWEYVGRDNMLRGLSGTTIWGRTVLVAEKNIVPTGHGPP